MLCRTAAQPERCIHVALHSTLAGFLPACLYNLYVLCLKNNGVLRMLSLMQELTLQEAETIALSILKQVMEEKVWYLKATSYFILISNHQKESFPDIWALSHPEQVTPNNVDIAKVSPNYHLYTPAEVEAVIARLWEDCHRVLFLSALRQSLYELPKWISVHCLLWLSCYVNEIVAARVYYCL